MWESLIMGNFPDSGQNNLIPLDQIEAAVGRPASTEGDPIAGLDIARYGDSETVWILRQGDTVLDIETWSHKDIIHTVGRTFSLFSEKGPRTVNVDCSGIGTDDADLLISHGVNATKILVGQPAINNQIYGNKRAEYYMHLKHKFANGEISIPHNRKLIAQLADLRVTYSATTAKMLVESKEQMRQRNSKSPDLADALMLAFIPSARRGKPSQGVY